MSRLGKLLSGLSFRSSTPDFDPGDVIEVMVTSDSRDQTIARIGDSTLRIDSVPADAVNTRVQVRVETWDETRHSGTATHRETVGESSF